MLFRLYFLTEDTQHGKITREGCTTTCDNESDFSEDEGIFILVLEGVLMRERVDVVLVQNAKQWQYLNKKDCFHDGNS